MFEDSIHDHSKMEHKEQDILSGKEAPKNILQLQMPMALELYKIDNVGEEIDLERGEVRDAIMNHWVKSGFSEQFRLLVEKMKNENRDPMNIDFEQLKNFRIEEGGTNN